MVVVFLNHVINKNSLGRFVFLNVNAGEDSFLDLSLQQLYSLQSGYVINEAVVHNELFKKQLERYGG